MKKIIVVVLLLVSINLYAFKPGSVYEVIKENNPDAIPMMIKNSVTEVKTQEDIVSLVDIDGAMGLKILSLLKNEYSIDLFRALVYVLSNADKREYNEEVLHQVFDLGKSGEYFMLDFNWFELYVRYTIFMNYFDNIH